MWPSIHPETGQPYRWYRPDGTLADEGEIPGLGDLPELPAAWLVGLTGHGGNGDHVKPGSRASRRETDQKAREWITALPAGEPCRYVGKLAADLHGAARREDGNAYDTTRDAVMALLRAGRPATLASGTSCSPAAPHTPTRWRTSAAGRPSPRASSTGSPSAAPRRSSTTRATRPAAAATAAGRSPSTPRSPNRRTTHTRAPDDVEDIRDQRIAFEVDRLRVRHEAHEIFDAERRGEMPPFDAGTLGEVLARPAEPPHRIDGFLPSLGRLLVVAMRKTGKTTLLLNLALVLLVGGFLGRFTIQAHHRQGRNPQLRAERGDARHLGRPGRHSP